jgi:hypothetical protein
MKNNRIRLFGLLGLLAGILFCVFAILPSKNGLYVIVMGIVIVFTFLTSVMGLYKIFGSNPSTQQTSFVLATVMGLLVIFSGLVSIPFGNMVLDWKRISIIALGSWFVTFVFGNLLAFLYRNVKKD